MVVAAGWLETQARQDDGVRALLAFGALLAAGAGAATLGGWRSRRVRRALFGAGVVSCVVAGLWIGANSPSAGWFGRVVSHGPRDEPVVALTFDDGPNRSATLAIARMLDEHGVKGTFFVVGKAVDARPDITRALVADGQLLGNHSFHHDSTRWLDPRYPELARAQHAIEVGAGVCPALFRPPHAQHTPLMTRVVARRGMTTVTWDVSVGDWDATDPGTVARQVLDRVRPGSIIDLHDGLDGDVTADRTVLVRAMPAILDGLAERGLRPVRLDQLLDRAGYLGNGRC